MPQFTRRVLLPTIALIFVLGGCTIPVEQHGSLKASAGYPMENGSLAEDSAKIHGALDDYLAGFRDGSLISFQRAFAAESIMVQKNTNRSEGITVTQLAQQLPAWASKPDPSAHLDKVKISFTGENMAIATFNLHYARTVSNDQLNFYRYGDQWKIATKLTALAQSRGNH